jgi:hypothetical protein
MRLRNESVGCLRLDYRHTRLGFRTRFPLPKAHNNTLPRSVWIPQIPHTSAYISVVPRSHGRRTTAPFQPSRCQSKSMETTVGASNRAAFEYWPPANPQNRYWRVTTVGTWQRNMVLRTSDGVLIVSFSMIEGSLHPCVAAFSAVVGYGRRSGRGPPAGLGIRSATWGTGAGGKNFIRGDCSTLCVQKLSFRGPAR